MRRTLVVMVKAPRPGRVKTRLARDIGPVAAAWWYRHACRRLFRRLADPRWALVLAVSPDAAAQSRVWPPGLARLGQGRGDLGARMTRLLAAFAPGPVVLVGSDIPGLGPAHVARAFAALGRAEAVLGPATDGGFWLIGARGRVALRRGLLDGVRWSTPCALADTRAALGDVRVALADVLADVDVAADISGRGPKKIPAEAGSFSSRLPGGAGWVGAV